MRQAVQQLDLANQHALTAILDASATQTIVASQDIVDENGVKLWASNQPVSHALQQKLLERKLRQPIESCLRAADGVNVIELSAAVQALVEGDQPIAAAIRPWGDALLAEVRQLPIHSVVQLLLTATRATNPGAFEHAVQAMALAGAMAISGGGDHYQNRMALLGGLLHDLGEMYVDPAYLDPTAPLTAESCRHLIVHPRIGELLLARQTNYPAALARAIGEHHERLDGTGYPVRSAGQALSPLGNHLSAVETMMGIVTAPTPHAWAQASLALRLIPGEFDAAALAFVSQAAKREQTTLGGPLEVDTHTVMAHIHEINQRLDSALDVSRQLSLHTASARIRAIGGYANELLQRLTWARDSAGLWGSADLIGDEVFELHLASQEFRYRMADIKRKVIWPEKALLDTDEIELAPLWSCLEIPTTTAA
jgi:hypothetical protein